MYSYTFEEKYGRLRKELVRGGIALASIVLTGYSLVLDSRKVDFCRVGIHDRDYPIYGGVF